MNRQLRTFVISLSAAVLWSAAPMSAAPYGTKATVPFSFQIGDQSYEAGHYTVTESSGLVSIQNTDTGKKRMVLSTPGEERRGDNYKLVFERIQGRTFLASVDMPERTNACRIPQGKLAKELKKHNGSLAIVRIPLQ